MTRCRIHLFVFATFLQVLCYAVTASAEVKLATVFSDHMVLQRDAKLPVWGWAADGEKVTVTIAGQSHDATATDGRWKVHFTPLSAGGPHQLTISGTNTVTVKVILVGEVWLCSGQSNMALAVSRCKNFEQGKKAAHHPKIRMFTVTKNATHVHQDDCQGSWHICAPETVGAFSGTAYFFGRKLHEELNVPVGLINSSWGGTDVAAWTSLKAQAAVPAIVPKPKAYDETIATYDADATAARYDKAVARWKEAAAKAKAAGKAAPRRPRAPIDPVKNQEFVDREDNMVFALDKLDMIRGSSIANRRQRVGTLANEMETVALPQVAHLEGPLIRCLSTKVRDVKGVDIT